LYTYDAIEFVKRRMKIELKSKAIHLEHTFRYEQRQKYKLGVNCNQQNDNHNLKLNSEAVRYGL